MKTPTTRLELLVLLAIGLVAGCDGSSSGDESAPAPAGRESAPGPKLPGLPDLARERDHGVAVASRELSDADLERWASAREAIREAMPREYSAEAMETLRVEKEKICAARGLTVLEYGVIDARITAARMQLRLAGDGVPIPPEKEGDCDLVRRHAARIDELSGPRK